MKLQNIPTRKGLAAIYRQEIIQDVTLFTSQRVANFYDKLFSCLDFTLSRAATGRRGFPKEAMVCAFIVMKCEGVHSAFNQHNERRYSFCWGYKSHVLVDCISGLPLFELTTPANPTDASVVPDILRSADAVLSLRECTFPGDKGYDVKTVYSLVKDTYERGCDPVKQARYKEPRKTIRWQSYL